MKKKNTTSEWISRIVFKAITESHEIYNGSMFSEYELICQSLSFKNILRCRRTLTCRLRLPRVH